MSFSKIFSYFKGGQSEAVADDTTHKFGTFSGVFVPNVTMMFGVILFMRLSIAVGYIPLWQYLAIIGISLTVMTITSLSIAMITTNMQIGTGGVYYLISRSLGIEFGGALGICLVFSQIISLAICTTGFAYTLAFIFPEVSPALVEFLTLSGLALISFVSANLALRTQFLIFCLLVVSALSVFYSNFGVYDNVQEMTPYFPEGLGFWAAFALIYPAMTGIEAGMALSGNLKNPSRSLWIGCLISLIFVATTYAAIGSYLSLHYPKMALKSTPFLVIEISKIPDLIYLGIWGATLSSALGNLLGAPRMMQSMAEDGIAPNILQRTYGKHKEPRCALALTFIIAMALMLMTTIDQIIPIAAMICLLTYGTLNLAAGVADWIHSPTWRPLVRVPWYISMIGCFMCFSLMFMISAAWSIVAIVLVAACYLLMRWMSFDVPFQDIRENIVFFFSRNALYYLSRTEDHAQHWHPQLLLFSKVPTSELNMIHCSSSIASRSGILSIGLIVPEAWEEEYQLEQKKQMVEEFLEKNSISGLVDVQAYPDFSEGVRNMIKSYGLGQLQPNTLVLKLSRDNEIDEYLGLVDAAKTYRKNLLLFWGDFEEENELFIVPKEGKKIAIWWSPDDTANFTLTLSYIHSLTSGTVWMGSNITLHAVVFDENQRDHVDNNLREFIEKSRFAMDYEIHIEADEVKHLGRYIEESEGADLVFSSLKQYEEQGIQFYGAYLQSLMGSLPDDLNVVFVSGYDNVDHNELYR